MPAYADTSFLTRIYTPHSDSTKALTWMQRAREALPFTPLHRHELCNAVRLRVFRGEITTEQRKEAFREVDADLADAILAHTTIPWADTFREAENLASAHTETLGVRSFDLLHVALATSAAPTTTSTGRTVSPIRPTAAPRAPAHRSAVAARLT